MKGYLYTLEVLIALSIIFGAILFVYKSPPPKTDAEIVAIKQGGFEALRHLSERGVLGKYAYEGNETQIEYELESILEKSIGFEISICSDSCDQSGIPLNQTVVAVDYYTAGYRKNFSPMTVRLYLWKLY